VNDIPVSRILFIHKEECDFVICRQMNGTGEHQFTLSKPGSARQACIFVL
jgi:hypothetical protein